MRKSIVAVILTLLLLLGGCVPVLPDEPSEPDVIAGQPAVNLQLSVETLDVSVGQNVYLPVPSATDGQGTDITRQVRMYVNAPDGSEYIPETRYMYPVMFCAAQSGRYVAVYTVYDGEMNVLTRKYAVINSRENAVADGFRIDGVLNEQQYSQMPDYVAGLNSAVTVRTYFDDNGMYAGVDVKDDNLIYNDYVVGRFTQSDGFELYLNFASEDSVLLNERCFRLQVNVNGDVWISKAKQSKVGFELQESIQPQYRLQLHGTKTAVGAEDLKTYRDDDVGYTFEIYLPYAVLGVDGKPDKIGFALSHRDVSSVNSDEIQDGSENNRCYDEVRLPENFTQTVFDNGNNYTLQWYDAYSLAALYNILYVTGEHKGIATVQQQSGIVADGYDSDEVYGDATVVYAGQAVVKAVGSEKGIYLFATFASDELMIAIATDKQHLTDSLGNGYDSEGIRITFAGGALLTGSLTPSGLQFVFGCDRLTAVRYGAGVKYIEMFIPAYETGDGPWYICAGDGKTFSCNYESPFMYRSIAEVTE